MTLTSLLRRRNPPPAPFEPWTIPGALWQLKANCTHHGRKMLRVCLMLLRDERAALNAVRVLDAWRKEEPLVRQHITGSRFGMVFVSLEKQGQFLQGWTGENEDAARIAAAKALIAKDPSLERVMI